MIPAKVIPAIVPLPRAPHIEIPRTGKKEDVPSAVSVITPPKIPFDEQYKPYHPFNSSYEVYIWIWLNEQGYQKAHQWELQITFGTKGGKGSTRVDFLSPLLMIAFYPDAAYYHSGETKTAKDTLLRAQVAADGYRVVQWLISSSEQLIRELPDFYLQMVYGMV